MRLEQGATHCFSATVLRDPAWTVSRTLVKPLIWTDLMFCGDRKKNATSDPDTRAEKKSKIITTTIPRAMPGVTGLKTVSRKIADKDGSKFGVIG